MSALPAPRRAVRPDLISGPASWPDPDDEIEDEGGHWGNEPCAWLDAYSGLYRAQRLLRGGHR